MNNFAFISPRSEGTVLIFYEKAAAGRRGVETPPLVKIWSEVVH